MSEHQENSPVEWWSALEQLHQGVVNMHDYKTSLRLCFVCNSVTEVSFLKDVDTTKNVS